MLILLAIAWYFSEADTVREVKLRDPAVGRALSLSLDLRISGRVKKTAVEKWMEAAAGAGFSECRGNIVHS